MSVPLCDMVGHCVGVGDKFNLTEAKNAIHTQCNITTVQDIVLVIISWPVDHFLHTVSVCLNSQAQVNGEERSRICTVIIDLVMMVW